MGTMRIAKLLGTLALVATLGLAGGCGGDDSSEAADSPEPSMTTSPALPPSTETAPTPPDSSETDSSSAATGATTSSAPTESASPSVAPSADLSQPPTTYDEAAAHLAAVGESGSPITANRFSTPGDAVYCVLKSRYVDPSCELLSGQVKDPGVCGNAPSDLVGRVAIRPSGAEPECNTDTIRQPGATTVQPPAIVGSTRVTCAVEDIGVTCVDPQARTGFFITQGRYEVF